MVPKQGSRAIDAVVVARVVTGGQSGADRAATDVAISLGIPYGGWVPLGGWAEDLPDPPGLLARYPAFEESASDDPAERTMRNVRSAAATLVLTASGATSPGTGLTLRAAEALGVPFVEVDLASLDRGSRLASLVARLPSACTLNVAGPRESERPGIYRAARAFLLRHRSQLFDR